MYVCVIYASLLEHVLYCPRLYDQMVQMYTVMYRLAIYPYRYMNTAPRFSGVTRTISFHVNDGLFNSTLVFAYVSLLEMNDPPILRLNGNVSDIDLMYTEGQSQPLLLAINATITGMSTNSSVYQDSTKFSFAYVVFYLTRFVSIHTLCLCMGPFVRVHMQDSYKLFMKCKHL